MDLGHRPHAAATTWRGSLAARLALYAGGPECGAKKEAARSKHLVERADSAWFRGTFTWRADSEMLLEGFPFEWLALFQVDGPFDRPPDFDRPSERNGLGVRRCLVWATEDSLQF